jgi:DNA-directed RNA polymerase subunit M/transcription elongation factor TFIIS
MNSLFEQKFKNGIISSKKNRTKLYNFLERYINDYCKGTIITEKERDELLYIIFYELYFEYQLNPCKENLIQYVKNKNFLFDHEAFDTIRYLLREENKFINDPPSISEGLLPCKFCKSKKTISFEKQTRSSDEAATLFINCLDCNKNFRIN